MTRQLEPNSAVLLRDQGGNARLVGKLQAGAEYRVGRMKIRGSALLGRQ